MEEEEKKPVDIYRDTPIRLLGYANEVGEAFRSLVHVRLVHLSYGIASAYVLADTLDKSSKHYRELREVHARDAVKHVSITAVDTLIWQALASVIIPGFTINRLCALTAIILRRTAATLPVTTRKWTTTAIGLGAIPFIVRPIDAFVEHAMNSTLRRIYKESSEELIHRGDHND